jgi:hypothetical protein
MWEVIVWKEFIYWLVWNADHLILCAYRCLSLLVVKMKFRKDGVGFEEEIGILKLMGLNLTCKC